ncbi:MAG: heat-inducible transcriptional repressor HrcA [Thermodesulfobacteriota bacterium]
MTYNLSDRDRRILEAVIQDYIRTAEPVGSRTIARRYGLELSPATIRNVMADLEEMGLLTHPHTSAGRIPTDQGLRFYVDAILEVKDISNWEQQAIRQELAGGSPGVEQILKHSSRVLSTLSRQIGIVMAPRFTTLILKQILFLRLSSRLVLAILVGRSGMIQNRIIEVEEELNQETLDRFNRYLNDILEGLTISEIKTRIVEEMRQEKNRFDQMLSRALTLTQKLFDKETVENNVYLEGQVNLLDNPEFADTEAMKVIFRAFEDKSILVRLLDNTIKASGVQIFIGAENELAELGGCAVIASSYSRRSGQVGALGIIGPTRIDYSRIIPVVDYTAKLVSQILDGTP